MKLPCKDCICFPICIAKRSTPGKSLETLSMECKLLDRYLYDYIEGPGVGIPHYSVNEERLLIMDHYFKHKVVLK